MDTFSYGVAHMNMKEILEALMAHFGDDAYSLADKSGVPQPTTQRFLSGKHGDPRSSTVRKWAEAYEISEGQMRGAVPLPDGIIKTVGASQNKGQSKVPKLPRPKIHPAIAEVVAIMEKLDEAAKWKVAGRIQEIAEKIGIM